jgi:ferritin
MKKENIMDKKLEAAFNDQINKEYYSAYLYLAMKTVFAQMNLPGFVNWFDIQVQEEKAHAVGMYNYVLERGGNVELLAIDKPELKGSTPVEIFKQVLEHEKYVTDSINSVAHLSDDECDLATRQFVDWYISEQVEEEANARNVITKLKMFGDEKASLYHLDKELGEREYKAHKYRE